MYWFYLIIAIIFEVSGTTCMKLSSGFQKTLPAILMFIFYGLCFNFFTLSLKKIEVSVAYSVWAGLGTVLNSSVGFIYFRDSITFIKLISIALIVMGIIGLNSGK